MAIYKKVPIAKEYEMSVDGHIRRVDGKECELAIIKETNQVYIPNINKSVDLTWLKYITHFEVDLPLKETLQVKFENSFQCSASNIYSVRMRLPRLPLIYGKYKIIPEFTRYAVSVGGEVYDTYENKICLAYSSPTDRYINIYLYNPNKCKKASIRLHRLVALAWVPIKDPMRQYIVNHLDGNKKNPHKDNLEWTSFSGNIVHAYANQLGYMFSCRVKDFNDGQIHKFNSIKAACAFMGIRQRAIFDFNTYTLFSNRYQIKIDSDTTDWMTENKFPGQVKSKPIQAYNIITREITDYPTIREASRQLNIWFATIRNLVRAGEQYTSNGYCFRYLPDSSSQRKIWSTNIRERGRAPKRILGTNNITKVVKEFNSASEAELSTGINRKAVVRSLRGQPIQYNWSFKPYWNTVETRVLPGSNAGAESY